MQQSHLQNFIRPLVGMVLRLVRIYAEVIHPLQQSCLKTTECHNYINMQHKLGDSNDGVHTSEVPSFSEALALLPKVI